MPAAVRSHNSPSTSWKHRLETMVAQQLVARGIRDERVLQAMRQVPRHLFVDEALAGEAYHETTLPIGEGQTLSQPYTVARMTEALLLQGGEEVLEIGTGSGYQTAVLAHLCRSVCTVERLEKLADLARRRLRRMGVMNVRFHVGDGSLGWPEPRRFQRILVTAGAPVVPETLLSQLAPGGILLLPQGDRQRQMLVRIVWDGRGEAHQEVLEHTRFVPLVGAQGWEISR